jgi:sodium/bile acid cotransporter 7
MALLLALVLLVTALAARALGFDRSDEAALVFCGSQKSLVSGVPIATALVSSAVAGPMLLPLMVYYPMQLLVCAWIARRRYALGEQPVENLSRATRGSGRREAAGEGDRVAP